MDFLNEYIFLVVPVITLFITQLLKTIIEMIQTKKFDLKRFLNGYGGMPSTHTSTSMSLATIIGIEQGFNSSIFALSILFTFIVIVDAVGVRLESEKQAVTINKLSAEVIKNKKGKTKKLKEHIGHEPKEVIAGIIVGVISAIILSVII